MLDENLPTFFLKPSTTKVKHHESFYFTQNGSDPDAQYSLEHLDPASSDARNTYAVALFDSHSPEILYGEVLAKPGWSHPTLSQDEIRRNGGVPPPPHPIYPTEFAIQLYNPESQIIVRQQTSKWSGTVSWDFSIPQVTFRTPSGSNLDRVQSDPGADSSTPQINFAWRKEGRMGKDMACYMTGKSTDVTGKKAKKNREPDIAVALFSGLKEVTVMEPNLYRIEIEDFKGLEVALLIGAAVIRDLFFGNPNEQFHVGDGVRKNGGGLRARKGSSPLEGSSFTPPVMTPQPPPPPVYTGPSQYPSEKVAPQPTQTASPNARPRPSYTNNNAAKRSSLPPLATNQAYARPQQSQRPAPQLPPRLDPRAQWEIEAETARLRAQVEAEEREEKRRTEASRKARRKQDAEEERKTRQFLEQEAKQKEKEDKERRRKQTAIDKETERLRKQYGSQASVQNNLAPRPSPQAHRYSAPLPQGPWQTQRPMQQPLARPVVSPIQAPPPSGQYLQPMMPKSKKSFWGLRSASEGNGEKLQKKKSSMF